MSLIIDEDFVVEVGDMHEQMKVVCDSYISVTVAMIVI